MNWSKINHDLSAKPEVFAISDALKIEPDHALGLVVKWFCWLDQQTADGALRTRAAVLDRVVGFAGFAAALLSLEVGWLAGEEGAYSVPNFDRHLGNGAKSRADAAERQARSRAGRKGAPTESALQSAPEPTPAAPKKARKTKTPPDPSKGRADSLAAVVAHCESLSLTARDGEWLWLKWEDGGWKNGGKRIADWQATVRVWERGGFFPSQKNGGKAFVKGGEYKVPAAKEATPKALGEGWKAYLSAHPEVANHPAAAGWKLSTDLPGSILNEYKTWAKNNR